MKQATMFAHEDLPLFTVPQLDIPTIYADWYIRTGTRFGYYYSGYYNSHAQIEKEYQMLKTEGKDIIYVLEGAQS